MKLCPAAKEDSGMTIFEILGGVPIMSVVCVGLSTEAFRHGIISPDDVMCF